MTNEVVVFPDVVATSLDYLSAAFIARGDSDVDVGGRIPTGTPERFVVMSLADAQRYDVSFQRSICRVECWTDSQSVTSQEDAQHLAQLTLGLLTAMAGTQQTRGTVYRVVDEGGPQGISDQPDSESGKDRYVFYVAISMRGYAT